LRQSDNDVDEIVPQHLRTDQAQRAIEQLKAWLERVSK